MGAGPLALQDPLADVLRPDRVERLRLVDPPFTEAGRSFALNRQVAAAVADARVTNGLGLAGSTATPATTRRRPPRTGFSMRSRCR